MLTALGWVEEAIVRAVSRLDVGLVTLGGDLVESDGALATLTDFVAALRAPGRALVATLGNWEHWGHATPSLSVFATSSSTTKTTDESLGARSDRPPDAGPSRLARPPQRILARPCIDRRCI